MKALSRFVLIASLLAPGLGASASDKSDKDKAAAASMIDSGTFGVFVSGQRVMTETFHVQQQNGNSSISSQLNEGAANGTLLQKSDMDLTSSGELLRYNWSQEKEPRSSLLVVPNNEFLLEKIIAPGATKAAEQPFLMTNKSPIVDNNFFIHRELLVWRFLKGACQPGSAGVLLQCKQPAEFGILVPQDRSSLQVRIGIVGKEKTSIHGVDRELLRLKLAGEAFEWALFVDEADRYKLIKVLIPEANTEVVRD
jgi:hypothetical protein